ncbi:unnamed protein product [Calypogeia fissa]
MAALSRPSGSGLRHLLGAARYQSIRKVGGAAQATVDVDFFSVPLTSVEDVNRQEERRGPQWVFLGCPGVGKGTYASRLAKLLEVPHIAMGDLVRQELKSTSAMSKKLSDAMTLGKLLPDEVIFNLLSRRLEQENSAGVRGFILDGFPRTISQAEVLDDITEIDLVVNLKLREDILIAKCLGRRICGQCGGNFNVAEIDVEGANGEPRILMPPLLPPPGCSDRMTIRADDTEEVVRTRLRVYHEESAPVEGYYREKGKLLDFNVGGGIPETWPNLLAALNLQNKDYGLEPMQKVAA